MIGDLLKGIEVLLNTAKLFHGSDHKREILAKAIFDIHKRLSAITETGREILARLSSTESVHENPPVALLSRQVQALEDIRNALCAGVVGDVLALHLPHVNDQLVAFIASKSTRVWIMLDQIISEGLPLSPKEWVDQMETNMGEEEADIAYAYCYPLPIALRSPGEAYFNYGSNQRWSNRQERIQTFDKAATFTVLCNPSEIAKGHQLLDKIAACNEQLRTFLVEKFHFEDIL